MLANKKTMLQIKNDLQLFLGNNTDAFSDWLQRVASTPELLEDTDEGELKAGKDDKKFSGNYGGASGLSYECLRVLLHCEIGTYLDSTFF